MTIHHRQVWQVKAHYPQCFTDLKEGSSPVVNYKKNDIFYICVNTFQKMHTYL